MKQAVKGLLAAALLVCAFLFSTRAGILLAAALDQGDQRFLFEYATEGRFDENVYFSREAQERTGILSDLLPHLERERIHGLTGLSDQIAKYEVELLPVFYGNAAYLDYLREKETSVAELYRFCENIRDLTENLFFACRYVAFLGWVIALHFLMKCRPLLYFGMGLLCVFASTLRLSNRLFAGIFSNGEAFFHLYADDLIPTMLEAMLTFLIFDITFAAWEKARLARRLDPLYQDLPALWLLAVRLAGNAGCGTVYRPDPAGLLPHFWQFAASPPRGPKGLRFQKAVRALEGPHTNKSLLRDLITLQSLLPPR